MPSEHAALLAATGELLSSSLDYRQTLQHVARLVVPALGDLCIVDVVEDGHLRRLATAHVRPDRAALLEELIRYLPDLAGSTAPAARALASGTTDLLATVTPDVVAANTDDAEHARLILAVGMRSQLAVPMKARGQTIGVISIGITESDRRFTLEDAALAEELAHRAALAVDNAQLYQAAQLELQKRQQAEQELRRSERRFRAIMEQSPFSTQILAPDGRTRVVNRAWEMLWGITLDELGDHSVLQDPQLDAAGISPLLRRAFAGEAVEMPVITYQPELDRERDRLPARRPRWVRAFAYPVRGDSGEVEEVVLLHEDVSDAHDAAENLAASEDRLQRALAIGRINAWDWDLTTDTVRCSDNAPDFWGMQVGRPGDFMAAVHPDDLPRATEAARAAIEDGAPYALEYRLRTPQGELRWVRSQGRVEHDRDGRPVRFLGMSLDTTERKLAEDATRMLADAGETLGSSLDYHATLRGLAQVVIPTLADWFAVDLLSPDGTLQRVSVNHPDPARVAMGWDLHRRYPALRDSAASAWRVLDSGQPEWVEVITDAQLELVAQDAEHLSLLRGLGLRSYVRVPLTAHGTTFGLLTMVFAESGRHYRQGDVALAMDLARRAAAAVDNARLYQQLQLADVRKDEFLAMLAHELRNPLAPISTAAQLLKMSPDDNARVLAASAIIARQAGHMTELVDDLLDVSRVTRGLVELEKRAIDIGSIVAAALEQVGPLCESRSQQLEVTLGPEPLVVDGDPARLTQVVTNLLNNAAKYTPHGGSIALSADADDGCVRLVVTDTGAGIEAPLLPHVFELFTQGARTPDRSQGGLGIGLALVRSIVELHGGSVQASSAGPGQGSRFTVELPRAQDRRPRPEPLARAGSQARRQRRILIVDDNVDAASVLAEVLRVEGHQVSIALDGGGALAVAARAPGFEICILDIGLPDMTGYELAERLRGIPANSAYTYVALTGYGQAQDRKLSQAAGFHHHLVKPADVERVLEIVDGSDAGERRTQA
ncbi:MAG: ATP-binding protein [Pseudomonadota bacterium]|nr:ATP-binding protein [Pseudomonadota bacterium]